MTTKQAPTQPTLEDVELMKTRLVDLELEAEALEAGEQQLTKQITEVHTGTGSKEDLSGLTQQRREARDELADLLEAAAALRTRIQGDLGLASVVVAVQRLKEIRKAYGGLHKVLEDDYVAVVKAAEEYKAMVAQANERFKSLALLRAEAGALADRFPGVPAGPQFPAVMGPARSDPCIQAEFIVNGARFHGHGYIATGMEKDAEALRSRRSYKEIAGTLGAAIIAAAGVRPWPPLTEAQGKILDGRKRDAAAEIRESRRFAEEGARSTERPGLLGAAGSG